MAAILVRLAQLDQDLLVSTYLAEHPARAPSFTVKPSGQEEEPVLSPTLAIRRAAHHQQRGRGVEVLANEGDDEWPVLWASAGDALEFLLPMAAETSGAGQAWARRVQSWAESLGAETGPHLGFGAGSVGTAVEAEEREALQGPSLVALPAEAPAFDIGALSAVVANQVAAKLESQQEPVEEASDDGEAQEQWADELSGRLSTDVTDQLADRVSAQIADRLADQLLPRLADQLAPMLDTLAERTVAEVEFDGAELAQLIGDHVADRIARGLATTLSPARLADEVASRLTIRPKPDDLQGTLDLDHPAINDEQMPDPAPAADIDEQPKPSAASVHDGEDDETTGPAPASVTPSREPGFLRSLARELGSRRP